MRADDFGQFRAIFRNLCLAVNAETDDAKEALYFNQLEDVPLEIARAAAGVLAKQHHRMPTVAHWRDACDTAQSGLKALPPSEVMEQRVVCEQCLDTGFIAPSSGLSCSGDGMCGMAACGRQRTPHSYTAACQCRSTNPVYQFNHPIKRKFGTDDTGTSRGKH